MPTIIRKPPVVILSGSPAWFVVQAVEAGALILATISYNGMEVGHEYAFASTDGQASFELSEYFNTSFFPQVDQISESGSIVTLNTNPITRLSRHYIITFTEEDASPDQAECYALKGAIDEQVRLFTHYGIKHNSFSGYIDANKAFLTFRPDTVTIRHKLQPERLYFLIHKQSLITQLDINLKIYLSDGVAISTISETIAAPVFGNVYEIKTSYTALVLPSITEDPYNPVIAYEVQVYAGASPVSKLIKYNIDLAVGENLNTFIFLNPAGGFDTFSAAGKSASSYQAEKAITELVPVYSSVQNLYRIDKSDLTADHICNTGFVDHSTLLWLAQMINSRQAYKVFINPDNSRFLVPVIFVSNSLKVKYNSLELPYAEFSYVYNYPLVNEQYS